MKRLLLSTLLGVISLVATAQTEPDQSVRIKRYQIELPAQPYPMFPAELATYKGLYDLSNGDTMTLRPIGRLMYAKVGNRPLTALVAAAPKVFVAVDRQLKVTLQEGDFGAVTGEVVMVVQRRSAQADDPGVAAVRLTASR